MSGYFSDDSMIRRVHRERAVVLSGPRALLMQAAHPLAVAGLLAHTNGLENPYERLARTAAIMNTVYFGPRAEVDRLTARVRGMHSRVRGKIPAAAGRHPAGTPYRGDQADLLLWVLFTLVDSAIVVYQLYVGPLSEGEQAAFWSDYRVVGELFGLDPDEMPETLGDLRAYEREMLEGDTLHVSDWARRRGREIVMEPPVPLVARPLVEAVNFVTVALLPDAIRRGYGFAPVPPPIVRRALVSGHAGYLRRAVVPFLPGRLRYVAA